MNRTLHVLAVASTLGVVVSAHAATIPGPVLGQADAGYSVTGLGFSATDNSHLTGFTFNNQSQADTVVLANSAGTILDSVNTIAGTPSDPVSVDWTLQAGQTYYLLQTTANNALFAVYGSVLPSDADIAITISGTFEESVADAVVNSNGFGSNEYWADFNQITTSTATGPVPEPTTWALMLAGFGMIGYVLRKRARAVAYG